MADILDEAAGDITDEAAEPILDETVTVPAPTSTSPFSLSTAGVLTGTVAAGTYAFTAQVTDALGNTATQALFVTIDPASGPGPVPLPGSPGQFPAWLPQVRVEAGMISPQPVAPPGTFLLDDPTWGKLGTGQLGDTISWTDITGYVLSASSARASTRVQGPLLTYSPGTLSVLLDNSSGAFDPDNLDGSPYVIDGASAIHAMVPIRLRATWAGITYDLAWVYADGWADMEVTYDAGYDEVTVTGTDGFKVLAGRGISAVADPVGDGEDTGARVGRILDAAGWWTDHRKVATGDSPLQATVFGDSALNLLQLAADSEIGELYIDGAGFAVFRNRRAILTDTRSAVVQAVFGDQPGTVQAAGTELAYASVSRANDDTQLANLVQITRATPPGAAGVTPAEQDAQDAVSIRKYLFPRTYSRSDVLLESDAETLGYAQAVLAISLSAEDRFETLTIDPLADPGNLFPQVLGREIGDRIQVWRRPAALPSPVVKDCFIRGITHDISGTGTWQTTWTLQDATRYSQFFILDDTTRGRLDAAALAF